MIRRMRLLASSLPSRLHSCRLVDGRADSRAGRGEGRRPVVVQAETSNSTAARGWQAARACRQSEGEGATSEVHILRDPQRLIESRKAAEHRKCWQSSPPAPQVLQVLTSDRSAEHSQAPLLHSAQTHRNCVASANGSIRNRRSKDRTQHRATLLRRPPTVDLRLVGCEQLNTPCTRCNTTTSSSHPSQLSLYLLFTDIMNCLHQSLS